MPFDSSHQDEYLARKWAEELKPSRRRPLGQGFGDGHFMRPTHTGIILKFPIPSSTVVRLVERIVEDRILVSNPGNPGDPPPEESTSGGGGSGGSGSGSASDSSSGSTSDSGSGSGGSDSGSSSDSSSSGGGSGSDSSSAAPIFCPDCSLSVDNCLAALGFGYCPDTYTEGEITYDVCGCNILSGSCICCSCGPGVTTDSSQGSFSFTCVSCCYDGFAGEIVQDPDLCSSLDPETICDAHAAMVELTSGLSTECGFDTTYPEECAAAQRPPTCPPPA